MLKAARKEVEKSAKSAEAWAADCLDMFGTWENHGKMVIYMENHNFSRVNQL